MINRIKHIITGCILKFTSIVDKAKAQIITQEQSSELVADLIRNTTSEIHRRRVSSFITDN